MLNRTSVMRTWPSQEYGVLLVAPEHRLSLLLKRQELWQVWRSSGDAKEREVAQATMVAVDRLAALPFVDILDESDELLHHKWVPRLRTWCSSLGFV